MCLGNNPYQCSVFWHEDENLVHFKYRLPSGAKQEDVKVEIDEDENLLTVFLSFAKKKEGDTTTTTPIISMQFNLPTGLDTAGFKTAIDDAGALAVTFTKLKPEKPAKKNTIPSLKKILGWLLNAVPICSLIGSNMHDEMSSGED